MHGSIRLLTIIGISIASLTLSGLAHAGHRDRGYAMARVVAVEPVFGYVVVDRPRENCWEEVVYEPARIVYPQDRIAPVIAGGVIGGLVGHELSHGRPAATLLGAAAGSALANEIVSENDYRVGYARRPVRVERCEVVHERVRERRVEAYLVTYSYAGHRHRIRTSQRPGEHIRVPGGVAGRWR